MCKRYPTHVEAIIQELKDAGSIRIKVDFRSNSDEKPGLHQGSPNVKSRVILRGESPAETLLLMRG